MPNAIKYNVSAETLALKKGNFWIGTGDVGKGPTSSTGYYNGITPPSGGYTIYLNKASGGPSIYTVTTEAQMVSLTNSIGAQSFTTSGQCLNWFATQTDKMIFNIDYPAIVTDGLVFNLDAGFTPSYPTNGTTWYDLSSNVNNGTLTNGPTFNSANSGSIVFDGVDDRVSSPYTTNFDSWTLEAILQPNGLQTGAGIIFFRGNNANGMNFLYNQTGLKVTFHWKDLPSTFLWDGGPTLTDNTWTHLLMTVNPTIAKFYVNGVLNSSLSGTYNNTGTVSDLNVGLDNCCGSRYFKGKIAKSSIYNRELTSTEVLQNFNAIKGRFGL